MSTPELPDDLLRFKNAARARQEAVRRARQEAEAAALQKDIQQRQAIWGDVLDAARRSLHPCVRDFLCPDPPSGFNSDLSPVNVTILIPGHWTILLLMRRNDSGVWHREPFPRQGDLQDTDLIDPDMVDHPWFLVQLRGYHGACCTLEGALLFAEKTPAEIEAEGIGF